MMYYLLVLFNLKRSMRYFFKEIDRHNCQNTNFTFYTIRGTYKGKYIHGCGFFLDRFGEYHKVSNDNTITHYKK